MNRLGLTLAETASRIWAEARARVALDIGLSGGSSDRDREKLYPILVDFLLEAVQRLSARRLQQMLSGRDMEMPTLIRGNAFVRCDNSVGDPRARRGPVFDPPCHDEEATRQVVITYNAVDIDVLFLCRGCACTFSRRGRANGRAVEITPLAHYSLELVTEGKQEVIHNEM